MTNLITHLNNEDLDNIYNAYYAELAAIEQEHNTSQHIPHTVEQMAAMEQTPTPYAFGGTFTPAPGQGNYEWLPDQLNATNYKHSNYSKDPIKSRHRVERFKNTLNKREKYGPGTMSSLQGQLQKARFENPIKANWLKEKIANRLQDNFTGRGMYYGSGAYKKRRRRRTYRGRGMYYGQGSYGLNDLRKNIASGARFIGKNYSKAASLGSMAANYAGRPEIGALIGSSVQPVTGMANFIGGRGAYNTLFPGMGTDPTAFESVQTEQGNLTVTAMEKVLDVFGNPFKNGSNTETVPFTSFSIDLTPGNFTHFPRLAQHAANFKEYEFIQLVFTYKSTLPPNWSTDTVTTGKIIMATEMDVERPTWTTYDEMFAVENKTEGLITGLSEHDRIHTHGVECDPNLMTQSSLKFVRTKGVTGDMRLKDYDLGRFNMGMFGTGANLADQMIGELYVYYKVQFKNLRLYSSLGYSIPQSIWKNMNIIEDVSSFNAFEQQVASKLSFENKNPMYPNPEIYKCDFNNINALFNVSTFLNYGPYYGNDSYFHGFQFKITFPSSMRGDYEITYTLKGKRMFPGAGMVEGIPLETEITTNMLQLSPDTTGTAILNHDINYGSTQVPWFIENSWTHKRMCVHVHLGQAVSTTDNTVTIKIPFLLSIGTATNLSDAANQAGFDPTWRPRFEENVLEIKQYNAQQRIGTKGFPFTKIL